MSTLTLLGGTGIVALLAINAAPYVKAQLAKAKEQSVEVNPQPKPQQWVEEIVSAAGAKASAEFILKHLRAGSSAADVMADRIKELEGTPVKEAKTA